MTLQMRMSRWYGWVEEPQAQHPHHHTWVHICCDIPEGNFLEVWEEAKLLRLSHCIVIIVILAVGRCEERAESTVCAALTSSQHPRPSPSRVASASSHHTVRLDCQWRRDPCPATRSRWTSTGSTGSLATISSENKVGRRSP